MQTLDALLDSYLDLRWNFDPVAATAHGVSGHDHRLGLRTEEDVRQHLAALKSLGGALEELDVESLDDEVDRTALLGELRAAVHTLEQEQPHTRLPGFWVTHVLEGLSLLLLQEARPREERATAAAARVRAIPEFLHDARGTLRDCPRAAVESALAVLGARTGLVDEIARSLAPADDPGFLEACDEGLEALASFSDFLEEELLAGAPEVVGIGEEAFNFRLHFQHALRFTAPELWRYGTALVEQAEADVVAASRAVDPDASWRDVVDRLRADHALSDGVIGAYTAALDRARAFVADRELATIPEGELRVMPTPEYIRPEAPVAAYYPPGPFAADRTGRFYVTPEASHCALELPVTALHEAYPGHHLQFLVAQAQERPVRRVLWTPLTVEGWALYCEEMMVAEGFLRTPEERLFQKLAFLWRACRVVIDVGLHTCGMTLREAEQFLTDRAHLGQDHALAEARRCATEPAYQLTYAVGLREVMELRAACLQDWGTDTPLRRFHDAFLRFGGLPVSMIRWGLGVNDA